MMLVLLRMSTRLKERVEKKEEKNKNYARFCLCRNSRRLRDASMVKTVSNETTSIEVKITITK